MLFVFDAKSNNEFHCYRGGQFPLFHPFPLELSKSSKTFHFLSWVMSDGPTHPDIKICCQLIGVKISGPPLPLCLVSTHGGIFDKEIRIFPQKAYSSLLVAGQK